uniref:Uncharacterized protein n=1 Tax=Caenorhabditis tropicalis TaxID=1561998 RepID=A0A1I7TA07_9PELO
MGSSSVILMIATSLMFLTAAVTSQEEPTKSKEVEKLVEVLRCFKALKDSGERTYVSYTGNTIRLFDENGREVSCDAEKQLEIRQRSDRRCIFSPIHCLFNRRLQTAKLLRNVGNTRLFGEKRRK